MLVLSRKEGERIVIGDNITVTVVKLAGGNVRIGVEAPADVPVFRQELVTKAAKVVVTPAQEAEARQRQAG